VIERTYGEPDRCESVARYDRRQATIAMMIAEDDKGVARSRRRPGSGEAREVLGIHRPIVRLPERG